MRLRDHDDDPDAPASEDERRAAAAMRRTLGPEGTTHPGSSVGAAVGQSSGQSSAQSPQRIGTADEEADLPSSVRASSASSPLPVAQSNEARWLAAHLRYPKAEDSLGEVKARRLARMAQESVQLRRIRNTQRASSWAKMGRSLSSTAGLLGAAGLLLLVSWLILDQGELRKPGRGPAGSARISRVSRIAPPSARVTAALLLRQSLAKNEDPSTRLNLMIQRRLNELRGSTLDPVPGGRGLAIVGGLIPAERGAP